jgi:hypothetical protein
LRLGLDHGRIGALADRAAVGDVVAVAEQLVDDRADAILRIALLAVAVAGLAGIRLGHLLLVAVGIGRLRRERGGNGAGRRGGGEETEHCHREIPLVLARKCRGVHKYNACYANKTHEPTTTTMAPAVQTFGNRPRLVAPAELL